MPRLLRVWVRKNDHHKIPSVGQPLRLSPIPHVRPTVFAPFLAREPFHLRVGKQFLTVLRRPQQVNSQPLSGRGSKCAAMRMSWASFSPPRSGSPVSQFTCSCAAQCASTFNRSSARSSCRPASLTTPQHGPPSSAGTLAAGPATHAASATTDNQVHWRLTLICHPFRNQTGLFYLGSCDRCEFIRSRRESRESDITTLKQLLQT